MKREDRDCDRAVQMSGLFPVLFWKYLFSHDFFSPVPSQPSMYIVHIPVSVGRQGQKDPHRGKQSSTFTAIYANEFKGGYTVQKYTHIYTDIHTSLSHTLTWAISSFSTPSAKPRCSSTLIWCLSLCHSAEVSFFMLPTWIPAQQDDVFRAQLH